ncbi:MAG: hypothetical protein ABI910_14710 [Gemmatimonadota bacterium]
MSAIGLLVLTGWWTDTAQIRILGPTTWTATNPLSALCIACLVLAIWILAGVELERRWPLARALAGAVIAVGVLRIAGVALGLEVSIDEVLFRSAM